MENPRQGELRNRSFMQECPWIDVDYCQFADWGYMKPTRIWGTVEGLQDVTCNVHTCTQLRPGTRRHRIPLGGKDKRLKAWDEYRVPDRLVRYLLTGSQEGTVLRVLPRAAVSQVVTVNDVVIAATSETILVNYQCMMRIGLSFGADEGTVLNVLIDT